MNQDIELLTSWVNNMLERELAINKLLESEIDMLDHFISMENNINNIVNFQDRTISVIDRLCSTNTFFIDNIESIIHMNYLMRE